MKNISKVVCIGLFTLIVSQLLLVSCIEDDTPDYAKKERLLLEKYLIENNITVAPTESGLYFIPGDIGAGPFAELGDTISMYFAGFTLADNIVSTNIESVAIDYGIEGNPQVYIGPNPFVFILGEPGNVFPGIEEGLTYMNTGSSAKLIMLSDLTIPGSYITLLYEIEVVEVGKVVTK